MPFKTLRYLTLAAATWLSACGGGGGGGGDNNASGGNPGNGTATPPAGSSSNPSGGTSSNSSTGVSTNRIVTTPPPAPTNSGEEVTAYTTFNTARATCGFGYLQQNAQLDTAALAHVTYLIQNNAFGHEETAGLPGFTGTGPMARIVAAGYTGGVWFSENITAGQGVPKVGSGSVGARNLLAAPYHLAGSMLGQREIGISLKTGGPLGSGADLMYSGSNAVLQLVVDMASSNSKPPQFQGAADVLTYPCQGVTGTATRITGESPNPFGASRSLSAHPIGQPIYVQLAEGHAMVITAASMATTAANTSVPIAMILTRANDTNYELFPNQALIIPDVPLATNTQYTVNIQGNNEGTAFQKNFTFTTGAN